MPTRFAADHISNTVGRSLVRSRRHATLPVGPAGGVVGVDPGGPAGVTAGMIPGPAGGPPGAAKPVGSAVGVGGAVGVAPGAAPGGAVGVVVVVPVEAPETQHSQLAWRVSQPQGLLPSLVMQALRPVAIGIG